jgi:hypothetical protein
MRKHTHKIDYIKEAIYRTANRKGPSLAEQLEAFLHERRKGKSSEGAKRKRARIAKQEKKARRLLKRGGRVKDIEVSKDFLKHSTERGEGSQGAGDKVSQTRDIVRQLKHTAHKHKKGKIASTSKHPHNVGTELVKKRSQIPDEDVIKTSTVKKPLGYDPDAKTVDITKVHTNKPKSHYGTNKMTSIVVKKDPNQLDPSTGKPYIEPRRRGESKRKWRKRTRGRTAATTFTGDTAPKVQDWPKSGHVTIEPKRDEAHTEYEGSSLLESLKQKVQRARRKKNRKTNWNDKVVEIEKKAKPLKGPDKF